MVFIQIQDIPQCKTVPLHNLKLSRKYLYSKSLTLRVIVQQPPIFQIMNLENYVLS